jgi:ABC-type antimicrobial peptide transport system permease subunit
MSVHIRVAPAGAATRAERLGAIRREIAAVDAGLPIVDLSTMRAFHDRGIILWTIRAAGSVLSSFGALALLLAAVGVYGVKSYLVSQRTREIGIRMALGASKRDVVRLVLRQGAILTLVGLVLGLPPAVLLGQALSSLLFDVSPIDPLVFTLAPAILILAATLASLLPAVRATRITPLEALRNE